MISLCLQVFEPFGQVELVQLPVDPMTGLCKGYGFIQVSFSPEAPPLTMSVFILTIIVIKASPRRRLGVEALKETWASLTPQPKISKTREEGRQKREEELEEDWEGQALVSAPSPSAPDAMAVANFCNIGHLGGAAAVSNSQSAIYRRLERIWKGAAPAVRTGRGRCREEWLRAAAAQMENGRGRDGEKSPAQRGAVAAETECLSMGTGES
jgi:hypothetical protein